MPNDLADHNLTTTMQTTNMKPLSLKNQGPALSVVTALSLWAKAPMNLTEEQDATFDRLEARRKELGLRGPIDRTESVWFSMNYLPDPTREVQHLSDMSWELKRQLSRAEECHFTVRYMLLGDPKEITVHKLPIRETELTAFEGDCYGTQEHLKQLEVFDDLYYIDGKYMSQLSLGLCESVPLYLTVLSSEEVAWERAEGGYPISGWVPKICLGIMPTRTYCDVTNSDDAITTMRDLCWDLYHIASFLWGDEYYDLEAMGQGTGFWHLGLQPYKFLHYLGYR